MTAEAHFHEMPAPTLAPLPRARGWSWRTVLLAAVLFVAGGVCGAGLTIVLVVRGVQHVIQNPGEAPARIARHLRHQLGLNASQEAEIRQIVARHQRVLQGIRRRVHPEVHAEFQAVRNDIDAVLTSPQRENWHHLFEQLKHNWLPPLPPPASPDTQ
ncbi:MAG: hypothetical protein ACP5XB_25230 [Isosphaeraceae bacterium]